MRNINQLPFVSDVLEISTVSVQMRLVKVAKNQKWQNVLEATKFRYKSVIGEHLIKLI